MSDWSRVFGNSSSINKAYGADSERQTRGTLDEAFNAAPDYQGIYTPPETGSALESQVGGDHYKNQGVQPFEITYKNFGYEGLQAAVYTKVNKYLTRDKGNHQENVEKAIHCLQIQLDYCKMTKDEVGNNISFTHLLPTSSLVILQ